MFDNLRKADTEIQWRPRNVNQCHAEGGATKGGVSKCEQTQANADKRGQTQRRKRKQTRANVSKRGQTQTNAYTPLYCGFLHPPFAIPLVNADIDTVFVDLVCETPMLGFLERTSKMQDPKIEGPATSLEIRAHVKVGLVESRVRKKGSLGKGVFS